MPCILYEKVFDSSDKLNEVKLIKVMNVGTKKSPTMPVWPGQYGVEALLMVISAFKKVSRALSIEGKELYENFDQCISGVGETI